ncbi:MAG: IS66 family transposase zinc-finger binding domain-containing protein [Halanaerobiales bacterium]|nr:IS66 family transposase zinc-finger binding domain-containing protein [Halanaerobiales bacterium]
MLKKFNILEKIENLDEVIDINVHSCIYGCYLSDVAGEIHTRQMFDMPVIKITVTEFRLHEVECPNCKKVHKTEFPEDVKQPVQYGINM